MSGIYFSMSANDEKRPSPPDLKPTGHAIAVEWMRQAIEEGNPPDMIECWDCGQWRPEQLGNDNGRCRHCGATFIPF